MTLQCFAFAQRSIDSASSVLELASHRPSCSLKPRSGSMSAAEAAQNGQKWAKRAQQRSPTGAPEERLGALRPGLRRQRGANWVPSTR